MVIMKKKTNHIKSISFTPEEYLAFIANPPDMIELSSTSGKFLGAYDGKKVARCQAKSLFCKSTKKDDTGLTSSSYSFPIYVINLPASIVSAKAESFFSAAMDAASDPANQRNR